MRKEKGLSIVGLICFMVVLGLVVTFGSQIGLGYLNQQTIRGTVKNALADAKSNDHATPKTVKDAIFTKLSVNTLDIPQDSIDVSGDANNGFEVDVDYIKEIKINSQMKLVMDLSFTEKTVK